MSFPTSFDAAETAILDWADPTHTLRGPTAGWWGGDLRTAAFITFAYLTWAIAGRAVMSALPAADMTRGVGYAVKFVYNLSQMAVCAYMVIESILVARRNGYSMVPGNCEPFVMRGTPPMANVLWIFYMTKMWDFWDTIFIVLCKRWRQLSFLHVYHHSTIFFFYWLNLNVNYDGAIWLTIVLNGGIHFVMYTYYFVSMHTRDIWWKKYLTMCQLAQFATMIVQGFRLWLDTKCAAPRGNVSLTYVVYIVTLFALFMHFFFQTYSKKKSGGKKKKKAP